ncbi:MAG: MinD/ParA family protein [Candidatus Hodarchaeota archaeon]
MPSTWLFHSYKGGTGKTIISLNVSLELATHGNKVVLFDFDFLGPSLYTIFENPKQCFLNGSFYGPEELQDSLIEVGHIEGVSPGSLRVGLANPEPVEINRLARLDKHQHRESFSKILRSQETLYDENVDFVIIDSGPGFRMDTANAFMISDVAGFILKTTESDIKGTERVLKSFLGAFASEKLQGLILNRVVHLEAKPWKAIEEDHQVSTGRNIFVEKTRELAERYNVPIFAEVPCLCDIGRGDLPNSVIVTKYHNHPFAESIRSIIDAMKGGVDQ